MKNFKIFLIYFCLIASIVFLLGAIKAQAASITVNATADQEKAGDGSCTLKEAVKNSNHNNDFTRGDCAAGAGADTLIFNIPTTDAGCKSYTNNGTGGTVDATSSVVDCDGGSQDPDITWWRLEMSVGFSLQDTGAGEGTTIDGRTQAAFIGGDPNPFGPEIELHRLTGSSSGNAINIPINSGGNVIRNLVINNGWGDAIGIQSNSNAIYGSYIGTDVTGTQDLGNTASAIKIQYGGSGSCDHNIIGGDNTDANSRNILSGNWVDSNSNGKVDRSDQGGTGVAVVGTAAHNCTGNLIRGNYIGLDSTGEKAIENKLDGIHLDWADGNTIGGVNPGQGNILAGHDLENENGIAIWNDSDNNVIQGNFIGTDARGMIALGWTKGNGIDIQNNSTGNIIGGANTSSICRGACNLIAGCYKGLSISSNDQIIQGNYLGVRADGTGNLANSDWGIFIQPSEAITNLVIGGEGQYIGNLIANHSKEDGIFVNATTADVSGLLVSHNIIRDNKKGISVHAQNKHSASAVLINNTFYNNEDASINALDNSSGACTLTARNNIIAMASGRAGSDGLRANGGALINSDYNDVFNYTNSYNQVNPGLHDLGLDPRFVAPAENDFHLSPDSPCIDAGDPQDAYHREPEPNGDRINLGAYGNTSEATTSPNCVKPTKGMKINQDTNLCPGEYSFNLWAMEAALKVGADNITITCQDTIITNPFKLGIGLSNDNHNNVVIQGCTFKNLNFGLMVRDSDNVMLRDVELTGNKRGVQFAQSQNGLIRNSRIRDNNLVDIAVYNGDLVLDSETNNYHPDIFTFFGEVEISDGLPEEPAGEGILGLPASTKLSPEDFY